MEIYKAWLEILAKIEAKSAAGFSAAAGWQWGAWLTHQTVADRNLLVILATSHLNNNPTHHLTQLYKLKQHPGKDLIQSNGSELISRYTEILERVCQLVTQYHLI